MVEASAPRLSNGKAPRRSATVIEIPDPPPRAAVSRSKCSSLDLDTASNQTRSTLLVRELVLTKEVSDISHEGKTPEEGLSLQSADSKRLWPRYWIDGIIQGGQDPRQWSPAYKMVVITIYCLMIANTTYASSAFAPSAPYVEREFHISHVVSMLAISLNVLGFAVGTLAFGPASEVYGRKPVYLLTMGAMTIFAIGVAVAQSFPALVILRFLAGTCGASTLNNVASSIVDMTSVRERMGYNIAFRLVNFGGPTLGPLVGIFITERLGWRANMASLPILSFIILLVYGLIVPETYRPVLERRLRKQNALSTIATDDEESNQVVESVSSTDDIPLSQRYSQALRKPFLFLFTEPVIIVVSIYTSILYGLLFGTLGAFPYVWQTIRHRSPQYASVTYLSLLGGFIIGATCIGYGIQDRQYKRAYDESRSSPESRIGPAVWAGFLVPIGLLLFAWTAPYDKLNGTIDIHYLVPCLAMVLFAIGMHTIFNSWLSYAADCYSTSSASAMSACTLSRSLLGAAFPLFMQPALRASSVQLVFSIFAALSFVLSFGSIFFVRYGPEMRARSKYATDAE